MPCRPPRRQGASAGGKARPAGRREPVRRNRARPARTLRGQCLSPALRLYRDPRPDALRGYRVSRMAAATRGPTVVKLGGSYALSPRLPAILAAIRASHVPVVVVPGGGPFADAVRAAQPRMGFGDRAAHRMALLAMAQFAE